MVGMVGIYRPLYHLSTLYVRYDEALGERYEVNSKFRIYLYLRGSLRYLFFCAVTKVTKLQSYKSYKGVTAVTL